MRVVSITEFNKRVKAIKPRGRAEFMEIVKEFYKQRFELKYGEMVSYEKDKVRKVIKIEKI